VPLRTPAAVGLKVTLIVQLAPALRAVPQLFVWEKSPLAAMLLIANPALPLLVKVTACAVLVDVTSWPLNVRLVEERDTAGPSPVPLTVITCGLPKALSAIVMAPLCAPATVGAKVILTVHVARGATALPQLLVSAKPSLVAMLVISRATTPVFVKVTA